MVHRRERYRNQFERLSDARRDWSIDDAITENLDLPELLRDYMSQLADAAECETAFEVLRSLTVCDPTVGSGAFLFAALDVLEPLYTEVLARATELEDSGEPAPDFMAESQTHPSSRYWLIKTICLHNLFGVDLMHEAPEIAKLRLFLKLAAQIERVDDLEPLPDLDFNIKCGNLLVGIADAEDAAERLGGGRLDLGGEVAEMETLAAEMGEAYDRFVDEQSQAPGVDATAAKQALAARFDHARQRCHELLHSIRGTTPIEKWVESHQPFHWFVEFPSVWRNGGFDVVIGNPPYIKKRLVTDYTWVGYKTEKCPDLYAVCMERATTLLNNHGRFAMIVMHSLCFSRHFMQLRQHIDREFGSYWVSSYSRIPDALFGGSVRVRNSILIAHSSEEQRQAMTPCMRWTASARSHLFDALEYGVADPMLHVASLRDPWPFLNRSVQSAYAKMMQASTSLSGSLVKHGGHLLGFKTTAQYMLGVFVSLPPTVDVATGQPATMGSDRHQWLRFRDPINRDLSLLALSGRWSYIWWLMYGDEFHVTRSTLAAFPGDIEELSKRTPGDMELAILLELSRTLQEEMPKHLAWKLNAGVKVGRYNMLKLRHITDRADWLLARAWRIEDAFEAAGNLRDRMVFGNKE